MYHVTILSPNLVTESIRSRKVVCRNSDELVSCKPAICDLIVSLVQFVTFINNLLLLMIRCAL